MVEAEIQRKDSFSSVAPAGVNLENTSNEKLGQESKADYPPKESQPLNCPECSSLGPFDKAGTRQTAEGLTLQRYYCKDCNLRFSELSCQLSNVTLVEVCWERFNSSVKA